MAKMSLGLAETDFIRGEVEKRVREALKTAAPAPAAPERIELSEQERRELGACTEAVSKRVATERPAFEKARAEVRLRREQVAEDERALFNRELVFENEVGDEFARIYAIGEAGRPGWLDE